MNNASSNVPAKSVFKPIMRIAIAFLIAILFLGIISFTALAEVPAEGTVVEGDSVPGVELGFTRAQVEAVAGEPRWCQNLEVGDLGVCSYPVEDGSSITVRYQGADGRYAKNAPDDRAFQIGWSTRGWTTTAGVNIDLALNDREAVVAAYPNAAVTYDENGKITKVEDSQLGIVVKWIKSGYIFPDSVTMDIYKPAANLPDGSDIQVNDIDLDYERIKSRRQVIMVVSVQGEQGQPVYGAEVIGTWTYPSGATQTVRDDTSVTGYAFFSLYDARNGSWTLTVDDVLLDGHPLDRDNSVLSISFEANRLK